MVAVTVSESCSLHIPAQRDTQRGGYRGTRRGGYRGTQRGVERGGRKLTGVSMSMMQPLSVITKENVTIIVSISGE